MNYGNLNMDGSHLQQPNRLPKPPSHNDGAPEWSDGPSSAVQTIDLSWALDTPWTELRAGHTRDQEGYPLTALVTSLIEESRRGGRIVSATTLAQLLRGTGPNEGREWKACQPITFRKSGIKSDITWWLSIKRADLHDPSATSFVSARLKSTRDPRGPLRCLTLRFRWSAEEMCPTSGLVNLKILVRPKDYGAIFKAIEKDDIVEVQRMISAGETTVFEEDWSGSRPVAVSKTEFPLHSPLIHVGVGKTGQC